MSVLFLFCLSQVTSLASASYFLVRISEYSLKFKSEDRNILLLWHDSVNYSKMFFEKGESENFE